MTYEKKFDVRFEPWFNTLFGNVGELPAHSNRNE